MPQIKPIRESEHSRKVLLGQGKGDNLSILRETEHGQN